MYDGLSFNVGTRNSTDKTFFETVKNCVKRYRLRTTNLADKKKIINKSLFSYYVIEIEIKLF